MRRPAITTDADALIAREARKRAECLTDKQIAEQTGQALRYIKNRMGYVRRKIELEFDPRETTSEKAESHSD